MNIDRPNKKLIVRTSKSALRNEQGAALIVALVLMIVIMAFVPVALQITTQDITRTANFEEERQAVFLAEAGLEQAKHTMNATADMDTLAATGGPIPGITADVTYTAYSKVSNLAGTGSEFYVRVTDNDDGDGDYSNDVDKVLMVESVGKTVNGTVRTVRARLWKRSTSSADFPASLTLVGPQSNVAFSNNTFDVWGSNDGTHSTPSGPPWYGFQDAAKMSTSDPPPNDTGCPGMPSLATESGGTPDVLTGGEDFDDCTEVTCIDMGNNTGDQLHGPSTYDSGYLDGDGNGQFGQTTFTATDAEDLWNMYTAQADYTHNGDANTSAWNTIQAAVGTMNSSTPKIIHVKQTNFTPGSEDGSLTLNGSANNGYGILIVDGDLDVGGSIEWHGVVLVGACNPCTGSLKGNGNGTFWGALVVGNTVDATASMTGNTEIFYSCAAIDNVFNNLGGSANSIKVLAWNELQEKDNPINP